MKYKVGDKIRVRKKLIPKTKYGDVYFAINMREYEGEEAIVKEVGAIAYHLDIDGGMYWWTDEMFEPVEEMSAEEAIRIQNEMCRSIMCKDCAIEKLRCDSWCGCTEYCSKNPDKVLEVLKQWKKDHEKKPIETEFIWYLLVVEEKTHIVKYEKPLKIERERTTDEQKEELLREWCSEHDGKYYVTTERRCVVKE